MQVPQQKKCLKRNLKGKNRENQDKIRIVLSKGRSTEENAYILPYRQDLQ